MCGIIGYVGREEPVQFIVKGLERLEYRGYDSAGVSCLEKGKGGLFLKKVKGRVRALEDIIKNSSVTTELGLAVAIPIMLVHTYLSRKSDHLIGDMEAKAVQLTNIIEKQQIAGTE